MTDLSQTIDLESGARAASAAPEATVGERLDRIIWSGVALVALFVCGTVLIGGFTIAWATFAAPAGACVALLSAAWFYRRRNEPKLASALGSTAQIAALAAVGAPLSYIAASANLPLQDHLFDAADHALGFNWPALLHWMNAHPALHTILNAAYMSFQPQATITVLALAFTGRVIQLRVFLLAFMMTALVTIAISAVLPAEGAWSYYGLRADAASILPFSHTSWPVFHGVRDGTIIKLLATGSEGIITFPSLHAALGLIFALALWPVPLLRWAGLVVNTVMIAGTPIDGSHFLADVIAGLLIALACWLLSARLARGRGADTADVPATVR